jgi:hypothetical protein
LFILLGKAGKWHTWGTLRLTKTGKAMAHVVHTKTDRTKTGKAGMAHVFRTKTGKAQTGSSTFDPNFQT